MATSVMAAILLLVAMPMVMCLDNGLALTPPMGWLSWQRFRCEINCANNPKGCISEDLYKDIADHMALDGYREAGYEYVNIDDCWISHQRDSRGRLQPDPARFPSGIKSLADYVHSKGLKLGIYGDAGNFTCAGYPGNYGYFDIDAQTYADWGVDMLKLDGCYLDVNAMDSVYPVMTESLNKTGRPILYSCSWPAYQTNSRTPDYASIAQHCNIWRNYGDIDDSWSSVTSIIDYYVKVQNDLIAVAKPGSFNDPDMLVIGNFGLSYDQSKAQMAVWAIFAAPLIMSNDLRSIRPEYRDILLNRHVIAVNQDVNGIMGRHVKKVDNIMIFTRPVDPKSDQLDFSWAVVFFNRDEGGNTKPLSVRLSDIGLTYQRGYLATDLFMEDEYIGYFRPSDYITVNVNPSGVVMLKFTVVDFYDQPYYNSY